MVMSLLTRTRVMVLIAALVPASTTLAQVISGLRWSFYETSDVGVGLSLAFTLGFLIVCLAAVSWIFKTGYRLKK